MRSSGLFVAATVRLAIVQISTVSGSLCLAYYSHSKADSRAEICSLGFFVAITERLTAVRKSAVLGSVWESQQG